MKEIIPIIIGVVIMFVQMYLKNRKKTEEAARNKSGGDVSQPAPEPEEEISLESFMESFFGGKKEVVVEDTPQTSNAFSYETVEENYGETEKIIPDTEPVDIWDDSVDPLKESIEYKDKESNKKPAEKVKETEVAQDIDNQSYLEEFDLEKAIIYDAVLNRPYS
jgi:hypothetical protein